MYVRTNLAGSLNLSPSRNKSKDNTNMFEEKTIGLTGAYSTHDALREGPKSLAAELSNRHPIQSRFSGVFYNRGF